MAAPDGPETTGAVTPSERWAVQPAEGHVWLAFPGRMVVLRLTADEATDLSNALLVAADKLDPYPDEGLDPVQ